MDRGSAPAAAQKQGLRLCSENKMLMHLPIVILAPSPSRLSRTMCRSSISRRSAGPKAARRPSWINAPLMKRMRAHNFNPNGVNLARSTKQFASRKPAWTAPPAMLNCLRVWKWQGMPKNHRSNPEGLLRREAAIDYRSCLQMSVNVMIWPIIYHSPAAPHVL